VPDQVNRTRRDAPFDEPLQFGRAGFNAAGQAQPRDEDAVARGLQFLADAGEVVLERAAERDDAVVPAQPVDQYNRRVEFGIVVTAVRFRRCRGSRAARMTIWSEST
jgi:hypothetical protein